MTTWNRVAFDLVGPAYQEIDHGRVERYVDASGVEMFVEPPVGDSCRVVTTEAAPSAGMMAASAVRVAAAKLVADARALEREVVLRAALVEAVALVDQVSSDAWRENPPERLEILRGLVINA